MWGLTSFQVNLCIIAGLLLETKNTGLWLTTTDRSPFPNIMGCPRSALRVPRSRPFSAIKS